MNINNIRQLSSNFYRHCLFNFGEKEIMDWKILYQTQDINNVYVCSFKS